VTKPEKEKEHPKHGVMEPITRVIAMPKDANADGDIFGGWIVSQMDIAGAIPAGHTAKGRIVTVAINSLRFHKPVLVGDVITFSALVEKVGRTSITIRVEAVSERRNGEHVFVTEATFVYVAIDENRKPRPVFPGAGES